MCKACTQSSTPKPCFGVQKRTEFLIVQHYGFPACCCCSKITSTSHTITTIIQRELHQARVQHPRESTDRGRNESESDKYEHNRTPPKTHRQAHPLEMWFAEDSNRRPITAYDRNPACTTDGLSSATRRARRVCDARAIKRTSLRQYARVLTGR